jgi:endonuclease/exonuclease/phosphatase family metal-dependent hydrolase
VRRPIVDPAGTTWYGPSRDDDRSALNSWAAGVGPAIVVHDASGGGMPTDSLVLVSWNTAVGDGDIVALVRDVRAMHPGAPFALLIQEAFRDGPDVPFGGSLPGRFAGRLGSGQIRDDIETIARLCGLNLYYVPSMRNGAPTATDEDRGNAILSTLPLDELTAIELPYERQRRVAVAATVVVTSPGGAAFPLRLVSAHLDNMLGPRRLWLAGALFARKRQMSAIVEHVDGRHAAVVGGDFNTWLGFAEPAFGAAFEAFPDTDTSDRRPTFLNLLRLDHLFVRLPRGWTARVERGAHRYGSDHWPLIATIRIG